MFAGVHPYEGRSPLHARKHYMYIIYAYLLAEVEAAPLPPLAAHAPRVGQLAEARPVTEATLVAVASARHAYPEHLHVSLPLRVALMADVPRLLGSFVSGNLWKVDVAKIFSPKTRRKIKLCPLVFNCTASNCPVFARKCRGNFSVTRPVG